jgi:UDP-GlcNAc:undecaprenyl-phosphate/decaprenyl-phosphate GlcNAc-1-phosphate transferase
MFVAAGVSFLVSVLLIPVVIHLCDRYKLYDPVNARKVHSGNIPRLGGIAVIAGFAAGLAVYSLLPGHHPVSPFIPVAGAGLLIFLFGIADDLLDLPARLKFLVQLTAAVIVVANGFYFTQVFRWNLPAWCGMVLSVFWIVGIVNAYNMIDGLDMLCGGLSFLTLVTFSCIVYIVSSSGGVLSLLSAAAILGFLVYNRPPARIFLGDGGSQFAGFMIAALPLYSTTAQIEYNKFLTMIVLVIIPMFDTFASIWRRVREHRPVMSPDRAHLHHKLLNLGYSKTGAVVLLFIVQLLLCAAAVTGIYLGQDKGAVLLVVVSVFIVCFFAFIHYTNRALSCKEP